MFYTSSSRPNQPYLLKWFASVGDGKYLIAIYGVKNAVVEILMDNKGNYIKSKILTDEYI